MSDDLIKRLTVWGESAILSKHFMGTVSAKETCAGAAAELTRLRAQVVALTDIAKQKLTTELETELDVENADFEGGYDQCILTARAALSDATREPKPSDYEIKLAQLKKDFPNGI